MFANVRNQRDFFNIKVRETDLVRLNFPNLSRGIPSSTRRIPKYRNSVRKLMALPCSVSAQKHVIRMRIQHDHSTTFSKQFVSKYARKIRFAGAGLSNKR